MTGNVTEISMDTVDSKGRKFYPVFYFMTDKLGLSKTELLVFALIYSFFNHSREYTGTRENICKRVNAKRSAVDDALRNLLNKGYITKRKVHKRGYIAVAYTVNEEVVDKLVVPAAK